MKTTFGTIVGLLVGLLVGALVGPLLIPQVFGSQSETRHTQLIEAVKREEQVVLLSLGIVGQYTKDANSELWGIDIPWSDRTSTLEYSFTAKLGIEGGDVKIESTGEDSYRITIPRFIFIGHQNENFRVAEDKDGVLSWITPDFDTADLITEILNDDAKDEYVAKNLEDLRAQAEVFYRGIVTGIDPDITLTFDFV